MSEVNFPCYPPADPDFSQMTATDLSQFISDTDDQISCARERGAEELFLIGLSDKRTRAAAELGRRNGNARTPTTSDDPIKTALQAAGLTELQREASMGAVEEVLRNLQLWLADADDIRRATVREAAIKKLGEIGISAPAKLLDAAIPKPNRGVDDVQGKALLLREIKASSEAVEGAHLIIDLCRAIREPLSIGV